MSTRQKLLLLFIITCFFIVGGSNKKFSTLKMPVDVSNKILKIVMEDFKQNSMSLIDLKISNIGFYNFDSFLYDKCILSISKSRRKIGECKQLYKEKYRNLLKIVKDDYFWQIEVFSKIGNSISGEYFFNQKGELILKNGGDFAKKSFIISSPKDFCKINVVSLSKLGDTESVKRILKNCKIENRILEEAFFAAARYSSVEVFEMLIKKKDFLKKKLCPECKKDTETIGSYLKTIATEECNLEILKLLEKNGIKVDLEKIRKEKCK